MSSPAGVVVGAINADVTFDKQGWVFKVSQEPTNPDKCVTLYDYSGEKRITILGDGSEDILKPSVQFRVRGEKYKYAETYGFCEYIQDFMRKFAYSTAKERYGYASQTGGINHLYYDDSNRPIFTLNFTLYKCNV